MLAFAAFDGGGVRSRNGAQLVAPMVLWAMGPARLDEVATRATALVGTRASTAYGDHVADELATGLAERDVAVVSGGAYGIDGAAHRAALAADGITVAVLAGGLDIPYPAGHSALLHRIGQHGLLFTEYPPGVRPARYRFLTRNRLVAAASGAAVVVEAGLRSGAANTAAWARALGRVVAAVPGPVTSSASAGCHVLLRNGAELVTRADDIVELVGRIGELAEDQPRPTTALDGLGEAERQVYEALPGRGAATVDEIAIASGLMPEHVLGPLAMLELTGLAESRDGSWRIVRQRRSPGAARIVDWGSGLDSRLETGAHVAGRPLQAFEVVSTEQLTPHMVRVVLGSSNFDTFVPSKFTDSYVKLAFVADDIDVGALPQPLTMDSFADLPPEQQPAVRTITVRRVDEQARQITVDIAVHGEHGVAGQWAAAAQPGQPHLSDGTQRRLHTRPGRRLASAGRRRIRAPGDRRGAGGVARARRLARLHRGRRPRRRDTADRAGGRRGELGLCAAAAPIWSPRTAPETIAPLIEAVTTAPWLPGQVHVFIHGEAQAVMHNLRPYIRKERGVDAKWASSISGYWRRGRTEEMFRQWKKELADAEGAGAVASTSAGGWHSLWHGIRRLPARDLLPGPGWGNSVAVPMAFAELEARAEMALPPSVWSYVAGGAGDERTQRANREAFDRWGLMPRMFVGAAERDLSVEVFGLTLPSPLFMAPDRRHRAVRSGRPRRPGDRTRGGPHRSPDGRFHPDRRPDGRRCRRVR